MAYPLAALISLHEHRELLAQRHVQEQRLLLQQAEAQERTCHEQWQSFAKQRPQQEDTCFAHIHKKEVPQGELEKFFAHIASLRAHELALQEAAFHATKQREEREQAVRQAVQAQQQCSKSIQKFQEHRRLWQADFTKKALEAEEKELEDSFWGKQNLF